MFANFGNKIGLLSKLAMCCTSYKTKFRKSPTFIEVNDQEYPMNELPTGSFLGIPITPSKTCLRGHVYVGVDTVSKEEITWNNA